MRSRTLVASLVFCALAASGCSSASPAAPSDPIVNPPPPPTSGSVTVSGPVRSFSGTRAAFQFSLAGQLIRGDDSTQFEEGSQFSEMADGLAVTVIAVPEAGFARATRVVITSDAIAFTGRIISMAGTAPELTLIVTARTVQTSAVTMVRRKGDPQAAGTLTSGQTVEVTGRVRGDGTVVAGGVNILADSPGQAFRMEGTIDSLTGACLTLRLFVSGYEILTSGSTTYSPSCADLAAGVVVEVAGVVQPDLTIAATSITRK